MTARGYVPVIKKSILQCKARSPAQLSRDSRRDGVFGRAFPVWDSDGCVLVVIVSAIEVIIGVEIGFVVDDVANAAGNRPVVVPKVHDGWPCIGNQIDVICRRVSLIENVGEVRLQEETGQRIPVQGLTDYMPFNFTTLQLGKGFAVKVPLAVDGGMHEIVTRD